MQLDQNPAIVKVSKWISNFFNPITSLVLFSIYATVWDLDPKASFIDLLPIVLLLIIPISIWIFWNVKTGRYTNMDVSNKNQRKSLYFFIEGAIIVYLIYEYFFRTKIDLIMIFLLILLILMQISNYFIKSSMHTAFNIFVAALFFTYSPAMGLLWLCIAILVGITRVILIRHTVQEVISGGLIAIFVSFIYLYLQLQMLQ